MIVKDALAAHAVATARVFEDRSQTVGASEVGACARRTYWIKMEGDSVYGAPRDPDYVDTWGATLRGSIYEASVWEPAMRRAFGDKLLYAGADQQTFVSEFLSATPDALLIGLPHDALAAFGVVDIGKRGELVLECKTIDPRGDTVIARNFLGTLLRFNKFGEYVAGTGAVGMKIPIGTKVIVLMPLLEVGYQHWTDNRPGEQRMGKIAGGFVPPRRAELGDLDKSLWDTFDDGREKDPWQFCNQLPMARADDHELFTFATPSKGGLGAIGELSKAYGRHIRQAPDELPIAKLVVGSYQHSNREYGEIRFPVFEVVGWTKLPPAIAALIGTPVVNDDDTSTATLAPPAVVTEPVPVKGKAKAKI